MPGSGQLPETMLVSEGLASAEAIMICVTCAANGASHEVQAQATAEAWLGLCIFKSKGHTEPVPPDTGPGVADAPPHGGAVPPGSGEMTPPLTTGVGELAPYFAH